MESEQTREQAIVLQILLTLGSHVMNPHVDGHKTSEF